MLQYTVSIDSPRKGVVIQCCENLLLNNSNVISEQKTQLLT